MAQSNNTTKDELNKALANLKEIHKRRIDLIAQIIPILGELVCIEKSLPARESKVDCLLRESVNLPCVRENINSLYDDHPNYFKVNGLYEGQVVKILAKLNAYEEEVPF